MENFDLSHALPILSLPAGTIVGRFLRREKRFSVAVTLSSSPNVEVWAHTNNTGTMLGLLRPGAPIMLSPAQNETRKLRWTVEALWHGGEYPAEQDLPFGKTPFTGGCGFWVGVNTSVPNRLLEAAFHAKILPFTHGYTSFRREAVRGGSRLDGLFEGEGLPRLWVECKNVTLVEDGVAMFPDAVSARGLKHLNELEDITASGERAAMLYVIQRPDGGCFAPAEVVDAGYAERFYALRGVEVYPYICNVALNGYGFGRRLPVVS